MRHWRHDLPETAAMRLIATCAADAFIASQRPVLRPGIPPQLPRCDAPQPTKVSPQRRVVDEADQGGDLTHPHIAVAPKHTHSFFSSSAGYQLCGRLTSLKAPIQLSNGEVKLCRE